MEDFGETIVYAISKNHLKGINIKNFGYNDSFVEHGSVNELEKKYGLDVESIKDICIKNFTSIHKSDKI